MNIRTKKIPRPVGPVIYIGADHAGYDLKEKIKRYLANEDHQVIDLGAYHKNPDDDYPDFAFAVAKKVKATTNLGILICGSAQGVCIAANKIKGIRAVAVTSRPTAKLARLHNDANVLCLSGWSGSLQKTKGIIDTFLLTPFSNEPRHVRRLKKITKQEK